MKTIRVILVIAVALTGILGLNIPESLAGGPYLCTISEAGPATLASMAGTKYRFRLTDDLGSFTGKYFCPASGYEKDMLAVALTALANGKKLKIWTEGTSFIITIMYIVN